MRFSPSSLKSTFIPLSRAPIHSPPSTVQEIVVSFSSASSADEVAVTTAESSVIGRK